MDSSISEDTTLWILAWGGGGGAGSFASQNTRSDPDAPGSANDVDLSRSQGQILFTFNPN